MSALQQILSSYSGGGPAWVARAAAGQKEWTGVANSQDGAIIVATANGTGSGTFGDVLRSSDAGVSWTAITPAANKQWTGVAMSPDGVHIVVTESQSTPSVVNGYVYVSHDSGATFMRCDSAGAGIWACLLISDDGQVVFASATGITMKTIDGGSTWAQSGSSLTLRRAVANSDCSKVIGLTSADSGNIVTTTDGGATWTVITSAGQRSWRGITANETLTNALAWTYGSYIYGTGNSGASWTLQSSYGTPLVDLVAGAGVSHTQNILAAYNNSSSGFLLRADNLVSGLVVAPGVPTATTWGGLAVSGDGNRFVACVRKDASNGNGFIYTYEK
ncbi:MAG: hypothetical protein K2X78_03220 [Burkholderiaceae bacterium]|nr:hypothetical protein [Burkholderiaceae bacterium]